MLNLEKILLCEKEFFKWIVSDGPVPKTCCYLNPFTLNLINDKKFDFNKIDVFVLDGNLITKIFNRNFNANSISLNIDFSGCASAFFQFIANHDKKIAFIGGSEEEIIIFTETIQNLYPKLQIIYKRNGYFEFEKINFIVNELENCKPDIVLVSMGSPRQENFCVTAQQFMNKNCKFVTSGAFITQASKGGKDYYPSYVRRFNIRWLFRMVKEPKITLRVLKYYFPFIIKFIVFRNSITSLIKK